MKYVVYSDIHAQIPQLEAVQEAIDKENADKEIIAGDLIMFGPEPSEVVENVRNRPNTDVIVGNLDLWVSEKRWETHEPNPFQVWLFEMAKQTHERLSEDQIKYIQTLPFALTYMPEPGHEFMVFHGTPHEIGDESWMTPRLSDDEVKEQLGLVTAEIMAHGHIHGPTVREVEGKTIVCAAAVGMNWDGDPRPAYVVIEYLGDGEWRTEIKRVEFEGEEQAKLNENCWMEHGDRVAKMIRTGQFWNPDFDPH